VLERTITPGDYYFHKVVVPLWRPLPGLILSYSERLAEGHRITISNENFDDQIEHILGEALPLIGELNALRSAADFLAFVHRSGRNLNMPLNSTDMACAHLLNGSIAACLADLKSLEFEAHQPKPKHQTFYYDAGKRLLAALDRSEASAIALLTAWREENVLKFKLTA
jgi:hypothetical protein